MTFDERDYNRRRYLERRFAQLSPIAGRQDWLCPACDEPLPCDKTDKDHIIPRARGGPAEAEWNWQVLHSLCNQRKREHMTEQAVVLAAERGVTLLPPIVRRGRGPGVLPYGPMMSATWRRQYA